MWIYFGKEPPYKSSNWKPPDPTLLTFNWTMTYQRDSDIVFPYGKYLDSDPEIADNDNRNWAANKTRLIVWMSSNCKLTYWDRQSFVKKLKKLIAVDMYGACGTLTCPRGKGCDVLLSSYKFYLALENSQCKDYISEKFWSNAFSHQSVPIVYGTSIENYKSVAPPHSFIHLDEFSNMAALVKYIKYLDKNDTAYNEYFEWKRHGSIKTFRLREELGTYDWLMCDILYKLREFDRENPVESEWKPNMVDMKRWWKPSCAKQVFPFSHSSL